MNTREEGKKKTVPCSRILNNVCRLSAINEEQYTFLFLSYTLWLSSKVNSMERVGGRVVESNHYFNLGIKINSNNCADSDWKWHFTSMIFLYNLSLIMRIILENSNGGASYNIPNQCCSKLSRPTETRKDWKTVSEEEPK